MFLNDKLVLKPNSLISVEHLKKENKQFWICGKEKNVYIDDLPYVCCCWISPRQSHKNINLLNTNLHYKTIWQCNKDWIHSEPLEVNSLIFKSKFNWYFKTLFYGGWHQTISSSVEYSSVFSCGPSNATKLSVQPDVYILPEVLT